MRTTHVLAGTVLAGTFEPLSLVREVSAPSATTAGLMLFAAMLAPVTVTTDPISSVPSGKFPSLNLSCVSAAAGILSLPTMMPLAKREVAICTKARFRQFDTQNRTK
jgi:hypothetical protein